MEEKDSMLKDFDRLALVSIASEMAKAMLSNPAYNPNISSDFIATRAVNIAREILDQTAEK